MQAVGAVPPLSKSGLAESKIVNLTVKLRQMSSDDLVNIFIAFLILVFAVTWASMYVKNVKKVSQVEKSLDKTKPQYSHNVNTKNLYDNSPSNFTMTSSNSQVNYLKITNMVIYILTVLGSLFYIYRGSTKGECIENCGSWDAEYIADPFMIAGGVAALLISSLTFQVINVFALFVEKSISK